MVTDLPHNMHNPLFCGLLASTSCPDCRAVMLRVDEHIATIEERLAYALAMDRDDLRIALRAYVHRLIEEGANT
jgi:hypothetical protein